MQIINLNLVPGGVMPVVNVSERDLGRVFQIALFEGSVAYDLTGKSIIIQGTKTDGNGFAYDETELVNGEYAITKSGNVVTIRTPIQMTAAPGQTLTELRITDSSANHVGTLNFYIDVEPSALADDTPTSQTDIPAWEHAAKEYAEAAAASASSASASESNAEAWAVGQRGGTDVPITDETYHNNAKYYADEAGDSATDAAASESAAALSQGAAHDSEVAALTSENAAGASATLARSWAIGGTDTRSGEDTNNSHYWSERSQTSANASANSAELARQYAAFVEPHFIIQNNRLYLRDDAVPEFIVAENRLCIKLAS